MATSAQQQRLRDHTIVALDLDEMDDALALASELSGWVDYVKVGSKMFTRYGPKILDELHARGTKVFLDLKFHDIPSVVGKACYEAAQHPAVFLLTVHASGGSHMIAEAVDGARRGRPNDPPKVVAVTALTSLSPAEMGTLGINHTLQDWAEKLALLAQDAGADGIVCSAAEVARMRELLGDAVFVTPGIRPGDGAWKGASSDDQTRVMTPSQALDAGSTFLVIGRPLYQAEDPMASAQSIAGTL